MILKTNIFLGLPKDGDLENYASVYKIAFPYEPRPMTLLFALLKSDADVFILYIHYRKRFNYGPAFFIHVFHT